MPLCLQPGPALWHTRVVRAEEEAGPYSQIRTKRALFPSCSGINDYVGQCGRMNHAMCPVHIKPMFFVSRHMQALVRAARVGAQAGLVSSYRHRTTGQLGSNTGLCIHPGQGTRKSIAWWWCICKTEILEVSVPIFSYFFFFSGLEQVP